MKHLLVGLVLLAAGCPARSISKLEPTQQGEARKDIPVSFDLDVLFVIDNSSSTNDKQTVFAQNYPRFVEALDRFPGGRPNLHLGVVTTSVDLGVPAAFDKICAEVQGAQNGRLQNSSQDPLFPCEPPTSDLFLSDIARPDGSRQLNYTPPLEAALSCISHAGDKGCGYEAPLEAIKRALDGSRPENAGFLRRGAFLAVIILTDEDDCSAPPTLFELSTEAVGSGDFRCAQSAYRCNREISPSEPGDYSGCRVRDDSLLYPPDAYARFLLNLPGPVGVAVALIAGDPSTSVATGRLNSGQPVSVLPSCHGTVNGRDAIGRPPIRLERMLSNFGDHGLFRTVCQSDYSAALSDIGALLFKLASPCLEGDLDTRDASSEPGLQPDCTVSDFQALGTADEVETLVPRCAMSSEEQPALDGARPCWWVKANPKACLTETGLELHVERSTAAAPNSIVRAACAIAQ